jgi:3,4-dihydroxy-2-butanone 4-phosphate synthase
MAALKHATAFTSINRSSGRSLLNFLLCRPCAHRTSRSRQNSNATDLVQPLHISAAGCWTVAVDACAGHTEAGLGDLAAMQAAHLQPLIQIMKDDGGPPA